MSSTQPKISIIVPVFNAGKSLSYSLTSLENQTYRWLEIILVDDCSTDNSRRIMEDFADRMNINDPHVVKIIAHTINQGVASARNTGIAHATGTYIYYVDADDTIDPDAIAILVDAAEKQNADIVGCNWYLTFAQNERRMNQPLFVSPWNAVQQILQGRMRWNLWLFMVRRSLYVDYQIRFDPGINMGEDLMVMIKLFTYAAKVFFIDRALYHYDQSNELSLTKIYSAKHMEEVTTNVYEVEEFLSNSHFKNLIGDNLMFLKLNIKLPLLISSKRENYHRWLEWFPESNRFAMGNKSLSWRIHMLQWAALKRQYWLIYLYYQLVVKFVYGILYR